MTSVRASFISGIALWTLALGAATLAYSPQGFAQKCVFRTLTPHFNPGYDSAVELELHRIPAVMNILTTPDGTLAPILDQLPKIHKEPAFLSRALKKAARRFGPGQKPTHKDILWSELTEEEQVKLIQYCTQKTEQVFREDRRIHGLIVKPQITVDLKEPLTILGVTYPKGRQTLQLGELLHPVVEFREPDDLLKEWKGIELHFRSGHKASENNRSAWKLMEAVNIPKRHQHLHIVGPIPLEELAKDPDLQSLVMGDFVRRANLATEMIDIVESGYRIADNVVEVPVMGSLVKKRVTYFASLTPEKLSGMTNYFYSIGKKGLAKVEAIADKFKYAWVGIRGADKYHQPGHPGVWGVEYRPIDATSDPQILEAMLDSIQYSMTQQDYGVSPERLKAWMTQMRGSSSHVMASQWYNQSWDVLLKGKNLRSLTREELEEISTTNTEVKMLFHDWSKDPLVFDNPVLIRKIKIAQDHAIQMLEATDDPTVGIVKDFLLESDLYTTVLKSMRVERIPVK